VKPLPAKESVGKSIIASKQIGWRERFLNSACFACQVQNPREMGSQRKSGPTPRAPDAAYRLVKPAFLAKILVPFCWLVLSRAGNASR
jgi:hypothetical protein